MSAFRDLMSIVDPSAPKSSIASRPTTAAGSIKPVLRPVGGANGASQPPLKRKASGPVESGQIKLQRKDGAVQTVPANGAVRATSTPAGMRTTTASAATVPYRGTAAPSSTRTSSTAVRKSLTQSASPVPVKATSSAPRPAPASNSITPASNGTTPASNVAPKKGYLALLQKAKEKDAIKLSVPPIKHEPSKILTRKERLALKAEASAGAKGKKSVLGLPSKSPDPKTDASKRKPVEVGYQGTARPTKKPIEISYRGTARPAGAPASSNRNGAAARSKPTTGKKRSDGYVAWDDLDDEDDVDDEEDDYASDVSSDMEGGVWDVEHEEQLALQAAKKEDAEALAEEMRLKREKDARKKKLMAMSKAAAAKKRL